VDSFDEETRDKNLRQYLFKWVSKFKKTFLRQGQKVLFCFFLFVIYICTLHTSTYGDFVTCFFTSLGNIITPSPAQYVQQLYICTLYLGVDSSLPEPRLELMKDDSHRVQLLVC
jgi:hypothetical protein